mgnify:CR=1 FL=1
MNAASDRMQPYMQPGLALVSNQRFLSRGSVSPSKYLGVSISPVPGLFIKPMKSSTAAHMGLSWRRWPLDSFLMTARCNTFRTMHLTTKIRKCGLGSKRTRGSLRFTTCPHIAQNSMLQSVCGNIPGALEPIIAILRHKKKWFRPYIRCLDVCKKNLKRLEDTSSHFYRLCHFTYARLYKTLS